THLIFISNPTSQVARSSICSWTRSWRPRRVGQAFERCWIWFSGIRQTNAEDWNSWFEPPVASQSALDALPDLFAGCRSRSETEPLSGHDLSPPRGVFVPRLKSPSLWAWGF